MTNYNKNYDGIYLRIQYFNKRTTMRNNYTFDYVISHYQHDVCGHRLSDSYYYYGISEFLIFVVWSVVKLISFENLPKLLRNIELFAKYWSLIEGVTVFKKPKHECCFRMNSNFYFYKNYTIHNVTIKYNTINKENII